MPPLLHAEVEGLDGIFHLGQEVPQAKTLDFDVESIETAPFSYYRHTSTTSLLAWLLTFPFNRSQTDVTSPISIPIHRRFFCSQTA